MTLAKEIIDVVNDRIESTYLGEWPYDWARQQIDSLHDLYKHHISEFIKKLRNSNA